MTHSGICRGDTLLIDKYYRVICALKSTKNKSFWKATFGQPCCSAKLRPNLRFPLPVLFLMAFVTWLLGFVLHKQRA